MNKDEFLRILEESLSSFSPQEKEDIMYDYEEHFRIGLENDKSEEEIIEELGEPQSIANQYRGNSNTETLIENKTNYYEEKNNTIENVSISIIAAISLLVFNLIFIVGPFVGLAAAIVGLFAGAIGSFFGGLGLIYATIFGPFIHEASWILASTSPIASLLFGIGTVAFGTLFFIGDCYIAKYFIKGTAKYIGWNLNIIKK